MQFDETLKSCPHCGGAAYLEQNYSSKIHSYFVFAKCSICGAQGKSVFSDREEPAASGWSNGACAAASAAWNMRTAERGNE